METKQFFSGLIGLPIELACKRLGRWWRLDSQDTVYRFERAAGGFIELKTEHNKVVSERHNLMAEIYQQNDL